jgi:hypothetical protein
VMSISVVGISVLDWSHESHEFTWNDPVEVSVFNSLIILILLNVEGFEVIPSKLNSVLKTLKDMEEGAVVEALSLGGVSVVFKEGVVRSKLLERLLSSHFKNNYHESSHEESSIDHLVTGIL